MAERIEDILIRLNSDESDTRRVIRDIRQVKAESRALADFYKQLSLEGSRAGNAIRDAFGAQSSSRLAQLAKDADRSRVSVASLREELQKLPTRAPAIADARQATQLAGSTGRTLAGVRSIASQAGLGGVSEALNVAGDFAELTEELPRLKETLKGLPDAVKAAAKEIGGPTLGLAGAVVGLTVLIKVLADEANRAKEAAREQIAANLDYYRIVATGTSESVEAQRKAAEEQVRIAEAQQKEAQRIYAGIQSEILNNSGGIGSLAANLQAQLGLGAGPLKGAEEELQKANKALADAQNQEALYARALNDTNVARNDAVVAAQKGQQLTDRLLGINLQTQLNATNQTADSIKQRIQALQDERTATQALIDSGQLSAEAQDQYAQRLREIAVETSTLVYQVQPLVEAREAEARAIREQLSAIQGRIAEEARGYALLRDASTESIRDRLNAISDERKALQDALPDLQALAAESEEGAAAYQAAQTRLAELNREAGRLAAVQPVAALREIAQARAELDKELGAIADAVEQRVDDLGRTRDQAIAEARTEAGKAQVEAVKERERAINELIADAGEQRKKINDNFYKAEQASLKRFNRSYGTAVANRDVLAATEAKQRRKDEQEANRADKKEALDALNANLGKQKAAIEQSYADQVATISTRLGEQIQVAEARYREQVQLAQQQADRERQIAQTKANQEISIAQSGANGVLAIAGAFWNGLVAQANAAKAAIGSAQAGGVLGAFGKILGFAGGGRPKVNEPVLINDRRRGGPESAKFDNGDLAVFSRPATIFSASQTQRMLAGAGGGNFTFAPNINGLTQRTIREQVNVELNNFMNEAGIPDD